MTKIDQPTILLWKSQTLANSYVLKVGTQRYVGLMRTDKRGETYWKFREYTAKKDGQSEPNDQSRPKQDLAAELAKAILEESNSNKDHENSQSTNNNT